MSPSSRATVIVCAACEVKAMSLLIIGLCGQSVFLTVPHFPRPEETLHATALFTEPGGKGYNQAVAAARMGAKVVFAGAVGPDHDGEICRQRLIAEGIAPLMCEKDGCTAYAAILTADSGENRVTVFPGVALAAGDVLAMEDEFTCARMVLLTPEIPEEAFAMAMALAKKHGVRVAVNPAPYVPWVKPYLDDVWLVTPNRAEACALLDCDETVIQEAVASAPYPRMVVTLGGDGALVKEGESLMHIPAHRVIPVDTTGAGDCLNGVLCAKLLEGEALVKAAEAAVRAASISVTRAHVLDAMPNRDEV